jgi:K+ transporter
VKKKTKTVPVLPLYVIKHKKPCHEEYQIVRRVFPDGVPLTQESMELATEHHIPIWWVHENLLTPEQREVSREKGGEIDNKFGGEFEAIRREYVESKRKITNRKMEEERQVLLKALTKSLPDLIASTPKPEEKS